MNVSKGLIIIVGEKGITIDNIFITKYIFKFVLYKLKSIK